MAKDAIKKHLEDQTVERIEEGHAFGLESETEQAVERQLKKDGTFKQIANNVIKRVKKIDKPRPMEMVAPRSPRKRSKAKKDGNYLRDW